MIRIFLLFFGMLIISNQATAQWSSITDYPVSNSDAFSFTIDGIGYVGGGVAYRGFYKYDPVMNTWVKLADFGGGDRAWAFTFVINGKAYVGCGTPNASLDSLSKDVWEYDPAKNEWTQKVDFGGGFREGSFSFSLNGKGYVGCGLANGTGTNDVWEYNQNNDSWKQIQSYPGEKVGFPSYFVINNKAYIGGGGRLLGEFSEFYEFNPESISNPWTKKADIPNTIQGAVGFAVNGKGYIGGGCHYAALQSLRDFYEYNPVDNTWKIVPQLQLLSSNSVWASTFVIGTDAYYGLGLSFSDFSLTEKFYKYSFGASGIIEYSKLNENPIFPNPVNDNLNINLADGNSNYSIKIINEIGFEIYSNNFRSNSIQINTKEFPVGTYFCKIEAGNFIETKKFVIIR